MSLRDRVASPRQQGERPYDDQDESRWLGDRSIGPRHCRRLRLAKQLRAVLADRIFLIALTELGWSATHWTPVLTRIW